MLRGLIRRHQRDEAAIRASDVYSGDCRLGFSSFLVTLLDPPAEPALDHFDRFDALGPRACGGFSR